MGLAMYLNLADVHRLMREGDVASGALLLIDSAVKRRSRGYSDGPGGGEPAGFKRAVLEAFVTRWRRT